jgi:hypothetical protein
MSQSAELNLNTTAPSPIVNESLPLIGHSEVRKKDGFFSEFLGEDSYSIGLFTARMHAVAALRQEWNAFLRSLPKNETRLLALCCIHYSNVCYEYMPPSQYAAPSSSMLLAMTGRSATIKTGCTINKNSL